MYQNSPLMSMLQGSASEWNSGKAFGEKAMRRLTTIPFVGMLALTTAGCGGSGTEESNTPTPPAPQVVNTQPAAKPFEQPPMVTQNPEKIVISSAPTLIQPTNANQRAKQVQKGRQDPFAGLFVQAGPPSVSDSSATEQRIVPQLPSLPGVGAPQRAAVAPRPSSGVRASQREAVAPRSSSPVVNSGDSDNQSSSSEANPLPPAQPGSSEANPLPAVAPGSTSEAALPPPPQAPDLASGVAVSGVVQVGSEPHAIVKVPNEATSRYVRVGQRLSNGQVLVKRIDISEGSEPVVILEQYGIEVAKEVGEKPANSAQTATSTNANPVPPPDSASSSPSDATLVTPAPDNATSSPTDAGSVTPPADNVASPTDAGSVTPPPPPDSVPATDGNSVSPTQDNNVPATDGSSVSPTQDNNVPATDGSSVSPTQDNELSPTDGSSVSPTQDNELSPTDGSSVTPPQDNAPSSGL